MPDYHDPELLNALGQLFATKNDIRTLVEYQQRLGATIQELNGKHREVQDFVRGLSDSHYRMQSEHGASQQARSNLENMLRNLDAAHRQTQVEIRRAVDTVQFVQQEVRKIAQLENRLRDLERDLERFKSEERQDDRKDDEQDRRLRQLESRR